MAARPQRVARQRTAFPSTWTRTMCIILLCLLCELIGWLDDRRFRLKLGPF